METIKVIKERRSCRGFCEDRQIEKEDVLKIVESAMYAPMALNKVSWHLTVVQDADFLAEMSAEIISFLGKKPNDHVKMRLAMPRYNPFYHAPTVIFVMGDKENANTNRNAGAAIENMLLAAKDMGIDSCWVGLGNDFLNSEAGKPFTKKLEMPENYEIIGAVALGFAEKEIPMPNKHMDEKEKIVKYIW